MGRTEFLDSLRSARAIAVIRAKSAAAAVSASKACLDGGLRFIEITMTVPGALDAIREVSDWSEAVIGAGTVLDRRVCDRALANGARFIVSPHTNRNLIQHCRKADVLQVPGAMTPTEIVAAQRAGADLIKIFPCASLGGASHIRNLRGPFPELKALASGGPDLESLEEYFQAGAFAVGLSGCLLTESDLDKKDWKKIEGRAREFVNRLARISVPDLP